MSEQLDAKEEKKNDPDQVVSGKVPSAEELQEIMKKSREAIERLYAERERNRISGAITVPGHKSSLSFEQ